MPTLAEKANFVAELAGKAKKAAADAQVMEARQQALEKLLGAGFSDKDRADLKAAMTFSIESKKGKKLVHSMDERGQRKSIETEDTNKYKALDAEVAKKAQAALEKITAIKEKLLAQTTTITVQDENGADKKVEVPLFNPADLAEELYTPLVRAGLMPEGLVIDDHSETAKLLKGAMTSYKQMLADSKKQDEEDEAETQANLSNAGTKTERASAMYNKAKSTVANRVNRVGASVGLTPEEMSRASGIVMAGVSLTLAGAGVGLASSSLASTVQDPDKGSSGQPGVAKLTKDSAKVAYSGVKNAWDVYSAYSDRSKYDDKIGKTVKNAHLQAALTSAAEDAVQRIDELLCGKLGPPRGNTNVVQALSGRFAEVIDIDAMVEATAGKKAQTKQIVDPLAQALAATLAGASPKSDTKAAFADAARQLAAALTGVGLLPDSEPPPRVYLPLVAAVEQFQFSDDFLTAIQQCSDEFAEEAKSANDYLVDELAALDEDTEEFERDLVLVDDAGEDAARERSLDKMTQQLRKDAETLELVLKLGNVIGSFGISAATLGVDSANQAANVAIGAAETVATTVGQELVPALKVAQLVIQMSVAVIKIAKRAELLSKFNADVAKAKKAKSALVSAVQNFRNNKEAQQIFASIELALQAVQLAGAICQTVPEPITMASGKLVNTVGKLGAATNNLAQTIYDEKTLRKGWKATAEALNNPKNRRAGLDAVYKNTTLAIHAIAWAATTKPPDTMAAEILNSLGVNAQTLADNATDAAAVIDYLETALAEDPQFKDADKVKLDWIPPNSPLSFAGWFTVKNRAQTRAVPPLSKASTDRLDHLFKAFERASGDEAEQLVCARELFKGLKSYNPLAQDGGKHEEMLTVTRGFMETAEARFGALDADVEPDTDDD